MISIRKRGNTYQYCFEAGKVNGKRKQITKCVFKTKNQDKAKGCLRAAFFYYLLFVKGISTSVVKGAYLGPIKHNLGDYAVVGSDLEEGCVEVVVNHIVTVLNHLVTLLLGQIILGLACVVEILCNSLVDKLLLDLVECRLKLCLGGNKFLFSDDVEESKSFLDNALSLSINRLLPGECSPCSSTNLGAKPDSRAIWSTSSLS